MRKFWFIIIKWPIFIALLIWASLVGDFTLVCITLSVLVGLHLLISDIKQYQLELDQQYKDHLAAKVSESPAKYNETINQDKTYEF